MESDNKSWKIMITWKYSQTWADDHLRIATTWLQWPSFWCPNLIFYNIEPPLNNDHLSTKTTVFGYQGWSLYTGLTVILLHHFLDVAIESTDWNIWEWYYPRLAHFLWVGNDIIDWNFPQFLASDILSHKHC